jgi:hypothetical protein
MLRTGGARPLRRPAGLSQDAPASGPSPTGVAGAGTGRNAGLKVSVREMCPVVRPGLPHPGATGISRSGWPSSVNAARRAAGPSARRSSSLGHVGTTVRAARLRPARAVSRRQRTCPPLRWMCSGRAGRDGSHVHAPSIGQLGAQLYSGSIATPTPQAFNVASPPGAKTGFGVDVTHLLSVGCVTHCTPAQIHQFRAGSAITKR